MKPMNIHEGETIEGRLREVFETMLMRGADRPTAEKALHARAGTHVWINLQGGFRESSIVTPEHCERAIQLYDISLS